MGRVRWVGGGSWLGKKWAGNDNQNKLGLELCQAQVWLKVDFRLFLFFVGDQRY